MMTEIEKNLSRHPPALRLFHALITKLSEQETEYLTIPLLMRLTQTTFRETAKIADLLASSNVGVLDVHYILLTGDDSHKEIDFETVGDAMTTGIFYDPESGEMVEDWENHVSIFYSGTELLKRYVGRKND